MCVCVCVRGASLSYDCSTWPVHDITASSASINRTHMLPVACVCVCDDQLTSLTSAHRTPGSGSGR